MTILTTYLAGWFIIVTLAMTSSIIKFSMLLIEVIPIVSIKLLVVEISGFTWVKSLSYIHRKILYNISGVSLTILWCSKRFSKISSSNCISNQEVSSLP